MRTHRLSCFLTAIVLGWCAAVPVAAGDYVDTPIEIAEPVFDGLDLAAAMVIGTDAGTEESSCQDIGGFDQRFRGDHRYRGNLYGFGRDVVLNEVRMFLEIASGAPADLYFSVHCALTGQDDPVYRRIMPDAVVSVVGVGSAAWYSSGTLRNPQSLQPGLDVLGGLDCAIGVSWGPASVRYGRDTLIYPQPFLHGEVLGDISFNLPPPVDDELAVAPRTNGVHAMQLCFKPVAGACCTSATELPGDCEMLEPSSCAGDGDFFHGETIVCSDVLCQLGACCMPCGNCEPDFTPETCAEEGGAWMGRGVGCPDPDLYPEDVATLCPEVTGACCDGANCREVCVDDCDTEHGEEFLGPDTDCDPNPCAGACCIPNFGCWDYTRELCALVRGTYRGDGTTCDALSPEDACRGVCCTELPGAAMCIDGIAQGECNENQLTAPTYVGDGLNCPSDPNESPCTLNMPRGACCMPDGSCLMSTPDFCDPRSFHIEGDCASAICIACCIGADCEMASTVANCLVPDPIGFGGTIIVDADTCVLPNPCLVPTGVCCLDDGSCDNTLGREECEGEVFGGRFQEGDADCASNTCPVSLGACCRPNGTCAQLVREEECGTFGGEYTDQTDCDALACQEFGACCSALGNCHFILLDQCDEIAGNFIGPGVLCDQNTCPTGACCIEDECTEFTAPTCDSLEGIYRGNGTACDESVVCSLIPGACCLSGLCEVLIPQDCQNRHGVFQGGNSDCVAGLCVRGACCHADNSCNSFVVASRCTDDGDEFTSSGSCQLDCQPRGACCIQQQCFDEYERGDCIAAAGTGDYAGDGTSCSPELCTVGACCFSDESCDDTQSLFKCGDEGGIYQGGGTVCQSGLCTLGACCHLDGSCDNLVVGSGCVDDFDEFFAGFQCRDISCPPRGACCVGEVCHDNMIEDDELVDEDCVDLGGTYDGNGTLCEPDDLCTAGACCLSDSTCDDTLTRQQCEAGEGIFLELVVTCDDPGVDCTRGSCCGADGTCINDAVPSDCTVPEEDFRADHTCGSLRCDGRGACCLANNLEEPCQILTRRDCLNLGGIYDGNTTTCDTPDLCLKAACCMFDDSCEMKTRQRCDRALGFYQGEGVTCGAAVGCSRGSCCQPDGECDDDVVISECPDHFRPGDVCSECFVIGACCLRNGDCHAPVTSVYCEAQPGGQFTANVECADIQCTARGACCKEGECTENQTLAECEAEPDAGAYQGDDSDCELVGLCLLGSCCEEDFDCSEPVVRSECTDGAFDLAPCDARDCDARGACCFRDGVCIDEVLIANCQAIGGVFTADTDCGSVDCPIVGACCNLGECTDESRTDCTAAGGVYQGDLTECTDELCRLGACCHLDGTCQDLAVQSECTEPFDRFRTDNVACFDFCGPLGACCLAEGGCEDATTRQMCEAGGTYDGDGTQCRTDLCVENRPCCLVEDNAGICRLSTRQECERSGGWYPGLLGCTAEDCALGSCCHTDGRCTEDVFVTECVEPSIHRPDQTCGQVVCAGRGACCSPDDTCEQITRDECLGDLGTYRGDASRCEPEDLCVAGACCEANIDNTCTQNVTRRQCEPDGIFMGARTDCQLDEIDCTRGACCPMDGDCRNFTVTSTCTATGEDFTPGLNCATATCDPRGACCLAGECTIKSHGQCLLEGGEYQGVDILCHPDLCPALTLVSSNPPDCSIDARQPSDPDGSNADGWSSVELTFDGPTAGLLPEDFTAETVPGGTPVPIASVTPDGLNATVEFVAPIPDGEWTCLTYDPSGDRVCLGFLPADVSGDGLSEEPVDILWLIDCLNQAGSCDLWQCDADRTGECKPADLLRVVDLLNGADLYEVWLSRFLDPCPTAQ